MRLIDASRAIARVEEIPILKDKNQAFYEGCRYMQKRVLRIFHTSKTIDSVPVVRCGECEKRDKSADLTNDVFCRWFEAVMSKTDFCSAGERKEADE